MTRVAILFDFDGTLVDTLPTVVECLRLAWRQVMGAENEPSDYQFKREIGKKLSTMMADLLAQQTGAADEGSVARLVQAYRRVYEPLAAQAQPFPGTREMLARLRQLGEPRGIVTNKRRSLTLALLRAVGMADCFDTLVAIEDVADPKPAPDPLWLAARQLRAEPLETIYVGDSEADIEAGLAAGVAQVALVPWGVLGELVEDVRGLAKPGITVLRSWDDLYELLREVQARPAKAGPIRPNGAAHCAPGD